MYMQWNKCTKLSPFYKLCLVMGKKGWWEFIAICIQKTKMRDGQNTRMNILTGTKMNTSFTPNRAKIFKIYNISKCNVITFPIDSNLAFCMETPGNTKIPHPIIYINITFVILFVRFFQSLLMLILQIEISFKNKCDARGM